MQVSILLISPSQGEELPSSCLSPLFTCGLKQPALILLLFMGLTARPRSLQLSLYSFCSLSPLLSSVHQTEEHILVRFRVMTFLL